MLFLLKENGLTFIYILDKVVGFIYNNIRYYYQRNIQNDIVAIYSEGGTLVCKYVYDAYGRHKVLDASGVEVTSTKFIGNINPYRYRGYYYDRVLGLYNLNSRYYDAETCRFISPDVISIIDETSNTINGLNLYMYCNDNPVMMVDPSGYMPKWLSTTLKILGGVAIVFGLGALTLATGGATTGLLGFVAPIISGAFWGGFAGAITGGITGALNTKYLGGTMIDNIADGLFNGVLSGAITGAISGLFSNFQIPIKSINKLEKSVRFLPELFNISVQSIGNGFISGVSSLANQNSVDVALTSFVFGMIGGFVGAKVSNPIKSTLFRSGSISMGLSITEYLIGFN